MNREIIGTVRKLIVGLFLTMALAACAGTPSVGTPTADARTDLAPSGKLRVALLLGSSLFVNKDPVTGEVRGGMAVEVGRALAERLGVPFEPVGYANVAKFMEAVKSNEWDIIVFGIDPTRAGVLDFTTPFLEVDSTYLVPGNSPIRSVIDADQPGVRIAVPAKSGQDLYFSRHPLKHAVLVRGEGAPATFRTAQNGQSRRLRGESPSVAKAFHNNCRARGYWRSVLTCCRSPSRCQRAVPRDVPMPNGLCARRLGRARPMNG